MKNLTARELAQHAGRMALEKKGFDVQILNLTDISPVCDYFVIVSGEVEIHVKAIAEFISDGILELGQKPTHREGYADGRWILLDYIDVVVHVFQEPTRQFYALEKLWGDAPTEEISDNPA